MITIQAGEGKKGAQSDYSGSQLKLRENQKLINK